MRRIQIAYETSFDISSNYNLISKTELKKITPIDPCEITFLKYNATKHVVDEVEVELRKMAKEVDKLIQSTDVKKEITGAWNALTAPIVIPNYGFVYVNPTSIGIDKLELKGSNLHFNLGLEAYPSAQLQPKQEYTPKTLPNLSKIDTETEGFMLYFDIFGTYDSLSNLLTKTLKGKEFEIKRNQIILDDIRVFGAKGNKLTIQAKFSGKKSGILYLEGTPVFDAEKQEMLGIKLAENFEYISKQYNDIIKEGLSEEDLAVYEELNIALPASREAYRALVESLDLTTESGMETYVALLKLSEAADAYYESIE
jgi:hypothetical protein